MLKTLIASLAGAVIALSVVISCGDDGSPGRADAATDAASCDCTNAEPSLQGRIVQVSATEDLPPNNAVGLGGASALCPQGAVLLGGGCKLDQAVGGIIFHYSSPSLTSAAWNCTFSNPSSEANKAIATAICLVPPPSS